MKDWLRFLRVPLASTAAFDVVACAALARGPGLSRGAAPLTLAEAGALCGTSVLVYLAGMGGNDLADRTRDRVVAPHRPLPSGRLSVRAAAVVVLVLATLAVVWGGGPAGARLVVAGAVGASALYNFVTKRQLAAGATTMGLVRATNASIGVVPLVAAGLASPLALLGPLLVGTYSAGITVLSDAEGFPAREARRRAVARVATLFAFGGAGLLALVGAQGLAFGTVVAASVVLSTAFGRVPRPGPVRGQVLEMLLAFHFLAAVLYGGATSGSAWAHALGAFGAALLAIYLAQRTIRALR